MPADASSVSSLPPLSKLPTVSCPTRRSRTTVYGLPTTLLLSAIACPERSQGDKSLPPYPGPLQPGTWSLQPAAFPRDLGSNSLIPL